MSISQTIRDHPALVGIDPDQIFDLLWVQQIIGISLVDLDGKWVHPSQELCRWLGYTKTQLEKMTWMDTTVRLDRKEDMEAVQAVIGGTLSRYTMLKTYVRRNETLMPATLVVLPIKDSMNKVVMFISKISRDPKSAPHIPVSELQIVGAWVKSNKKSLLTFIIVWTILTAIAGERFIGWFVESVQ